MLWGSRRYNVITGKSWGVLILKSDWEILHFYVNFWSDHMDFLLSEYKSTSTCRRFLLWPLSNAHLEVSKVTACSMNSRKESDLVVCFPCGVKWEKNKRDYKRKINWLSCHLEGCFLEKLAVYLAKTTSCFNPLCFNLHCNWTKE